ncbi:MAG: hypothetical protein H7Y20_16000, partial [Bryobacteraceae bacterium]|nr:hypothetical protein [Bryobacteraceae bacterium]
QFDEVKNEIAIERKRESVFNRMQQAMDQARAELVKAPQNAQQIAVKHNLGYHKVENQKKGDPLPELGNSAEVDNAVTGLRPNEVSPVFQLGPNALAVTEMIQVSAPRPAELAEVENEIRDKILSQKAQQLADKQMKDATDKLKAGAAGGDVNVLAKQVGGEVKTSDFFASEGAAEGIGSASYLADGFTKGVGAMVGPFTVGNQVFLAKVIEKQAADPAKLAADRESLVLSLKKKRAAERKELFEDGLMTQLIKEGKVKKNPETITRIVQGYRG